MSNVLGEDLIRKSHSPDILESNQNNESFSPIMNNYTPPEPPRRTSINAILTDDPIVRDYIARKQKRMNNSNLTTRRRNELPDFIMTLSRDILNLIPDNQREMKIIIDFYNDMASFIVKVLSAYAKKDCKQGRIQNTDDFKFLAKKLNSNILLKKLQRKKLDDLNLTENVKQNIVVYIKTYMLKFGKFYKRKNEDL